MEKTVLQQALSLHQAGRLGQARLLYEQILKTEPDHFDALHMLGVIFAQKKNFALSFEMMNKAIARNPGSATAYNNRGIALQELKRHRAAVKSFDQAIALRPGHAKAHFNRGNALRSLQQYSAAVDSYNKAVQLKPDHAATYVVRGESLRDLKKYRAALADYDKAISLKPDYDFLQGTRLHTKLQTCDWSGIEELQSQLEQEIANGKKVAVPFAVPALTGNPGLQKKAASIYLQDQYPANQLLGELQRYDKHEKIRIAYFSADFRKHPVSLLTAEMFELHDRSKFELMAFSFGPDTGDQVRARVAAAFDQFIDVREKTDKAIAKLARTMEIDIAIDLTGLTSDARPGVFALRAAPIQVNYLGYPGSIDSGYHDYIIADRTVIPESRRNDYSEKIAHLPDSYMANDSKKKISETKFTREELGLPPKGFIFCCFNNHYKISPVTFAGWMRILAKVTDSILWLPDAGPFAKDNLRQAAVAHGIDPERIYFAPKLPKLADHLARLKVADLFLDTLPFNAHATASDALWAGLPLLTCSGEAFAGRVAASLLNALELPELITTSQQAYELRAIKLASEAASLDKIRKKLARNRLSSALFDSRNFVKHIESAYITMHERHHADLPPDHITVTRKLKPKSLPAKPKSRSKTRK